MRKVLFEPLSHMQFNEWERTDKKMFYKIAGLIAEVRDEPFRGIGKPEPLKHQLKGCWSRRITKEHFDKLSAAHRLVYQVTSDSIIVISCKYHY